MKLLQNSFKILLIHTMNSNLLTSIGTVIGIVIAYLSKEWYDNYKRKKDSDKKKEHSFTINDLGAEIRQKINEFIIEIQGYTQCSRCHIIEFSNGVKTMDDVCMQYENMTYEKTNSVIRPIIREFQKMPINPFIAKVNALKNSKDGVANFSLKTTEDKSIIDVLNFYDIKNTYHFRFNNNVWCGFMVVSFIGTYEELTTEQIEQIKIKVQHIEMLMQQLKNLK